MEIAVTSLYVTVHKLFERLIKSGYPVEILRSELLQKHTALSESLNNVYKNSVYSKTLH
jgi:hypothetical protein